MRTFSYISREYVPSIDLTTLGQTYNTLEQGHQEAVKASSDLEAAVAQLDMNEAEDGFKQQLINEIKTTVDENSIYGNSYAALDDVIAKAGDIQSDGRVIGRLRSQKAKKEYDAKVDAMAIPEGMKQMYKEENPYYYEDGAVDVTTGRVLPGELWTPTTNPVNTIADADIQKYALSIAAKEAGGGESISFLDANGNETYDPSQSVDGAFYRKVGTKYERLSKDKIRQAYQIAIDSIPGARDSLAQDYKYQQWQYDKLVEDAEQKGGDTTPYIKGFTDKNGNIYTQEQWLNNKINNFADVAAYNHVYSSVDYGTALQNRQARQAQAAAGNGANPSIYDTNRLGSIISGTEEVESNAFAGVSKAKSDANNTALNIINKVAKNKLHNIDSVTDLIIAARKHDKNIRGPRGAAFWYLNKYGKNLTPTERTQFINAMTGYVQANQQYNQMVKAAGSQGGDLRFSANVANNEYTNDNKYGKAIIGELNNIFKNNDSVTYELGKDVYDAVKHLYNTNDLRRVGLNYTINEDGNYLITFTGNNRNLMPKFDSLVEKADSQVDGNFGGWFKKAFTGKAASGNYVVHFNNKNGRTNTRNISGGGILANIYDKGIEAASKVETKVGVAKGTRSFSTGNYASFGAAYAAMNPQIAEQTGETLQQYINRQNEQVDLAFAQGAFDAGQIQYLDAANRAITDISKNQEAKALIQNMYADDTQRKKIKRAIKIPTGTEAGGTQGYVLTFKVPKDFGSKHFKEGEDVRIIVSGVSDEESGFNPSINPDVLASNAIVTSRATGGPIQIKGYTDNLGNTDLVPTKNGKFTTTFMGNPTIMDSVEAEYYTTLMYTMEQFKNQLYSGAYNFNDPNQVKLANNKFNELVNGISSVTGLNPNSVRTALQNEFQIND